MTQQPQLAEEAAKLIENEFPMLAGVDDLADRLAVSKCHLIRCFTAYYGISPGRQLTAVRLAAVQDYLARSDYTVEMIAGLTGFACGNYLCKVFRRSVGISPGEYQRRCHLTAPLNPADKQRFAARSEDISFI
ncbi:MAG: helix-turn-helix transcriptional regulator [Angelakisella sp.]